MSTVSLAPLGRIGGLEASEGAVAGTQRSGACGQRHGQKPEEGREKNLEDASEGPAEWVETREMGGSRPPLRFLLQTLVLFCFVFFFCRRD